MKTPVVVCAILISTAAWSGEGDVHLKDAPGRDLVAANCTMCHSLDYIQMNSPFLDHKGWEAAVNKMIKVMGAPIAQGDAQQIVDYLASQYGR